MAVTDWTYTDSGIAVAPEFGAVHDEAWRRLGECGTWWTGAQRVAILAESRASESCEFCSARAEAVSPYAVEGAHATSERADELPLDAIDAIHRISSDPGRLTREWVEGVCGSIGEEPYVELAAIVATRYAVDGFAVGLGVEPRPLPDAGEGEPTRIRPEGVGDVGAFVSQSLDKRLANVSRAASLVPDTMDIWTSTVTQQYSRGMEFAELVWDRPLGRPQVEVVAATVSRLNECFY